ncbi:hypothetical protein DBT73_RS13105 [Vibrio parahaemolyticus]|nr:hypothetical protein [Vibrio parahaemolyticus]EJC7127308.1 hypothetical protein [Vibrio parahaemolyticus]EJG0221828.1 hypothetical protein [Vibrio parahaemolyticus]EJG0231144.1 hypothetical protein [Vibrio parahaemolyticus]EJG0248991.1 hypothetical protein [Vibrio parahaemolyticus]
MKDRELELVGEPIEILDTDPPKHEQHFGDKEGISRDDPIQMEFDFEFT